MLKPFPFPLRLPICAAPMFLVSGPEMVVNACTAGIIGSFPASNCRTPEELDQWMGDIAARLADAKAKASGIPVAPWAANVVTHSTNPRLAAHLELLARHKPPIVITALGSPKPAIDIVHGYGGLVVADVPNIGLARKAVDAGADGLACIAAGAGGHTGHLSPFAFVSAVREFFDGWVVLGGGIADGAGIAAAIAAGADLVYVGTRFLAAAESLAVPAYKQMVIDSGLDDLVVSAAVTGTAASWLRPSLAACGIDPAASVVRDYSGHPLKRWRDTWSAGQGLQSVRSVETVAAIVDDLAAGYTEAVKRFDAHARRVGIRD